MDWEQALVWVQLLMWPVTVFLSAWVFAQAVAIAAKHKRRSAQHAADQELEATKLTLETDKKLAEQKLNHEENLRWFDETCRHGVWVAYTDGQISVSFLKEGGWTLMCTAELADGQTYAYLLPKSFSGERVVGGSVPYTPMLTKKTNYCGSSIFGGFDSTPDPFAHSGMVGRFNMVPSGFIQ